MTFLGNPRMTVTAGALLAGALLTSAAVAGPALSPSVAQGAKPTQESNVQLVRDGRGWGRGGWRGHRGFGRGLGWGLGAAAATGLLLSAPYAYGYDDDGYYGYGDGYYARGYGDRYYAGGYDDGDEGDAGFARCQQTFRSFDPDSGTYMGYDGVRRRCPFI